MGCAPGALRHGRELDVVRQREEQRAVLVADLDVVLEAREAPAIRRVEEHAAQMADAATEVLPLLVAVVRIARAVLVRLLLLDTAVAHHAVDLGDRPARGDVLSRGAALLRGITCEKQNNWTMRRRMVMFQNLRFLKTNQDSTDSHSRHGTWEATDRECRHASGNAIEATGGEGVGAVAPHLGGVLRSLVWNKFTQSCLGIGDRAVQNDVPTKKRSTLATPCQALQSRLLGGADFF